MGPFARVLLGVLVVLSACRDTDRDGTRDGLDCLPENPAAFRGAEEVCDGIDNDCDGQVDEDVAIVAYWDRDRDGFGDPDFVRRVCSLPADGSLVAGDCDDLDTLTNPDAVEICDLLDNDCDGDIDEDVLRDFYVDADGDGRGDPTQTVQACFAGPGRALAPDDCNDAEPEAWTDRPEICDDIDNDCDTEIDEDTEDLRLWADADGDGYGDPDSVVLACGPGAGVVDNDWDCDDQDANRSPDTQEVRGNGEDEDCDDYDDELGVGDPASNEFATLDAALAAVSDGDVVQFDGGTHFVNVDLRDQNGVTETFTLAGEGCGRTILVGQAAGSVLRMDKGRLERLTVSGGTGQFVPATELTVGGGLLATGDVTVAQTCFEQNTAASHGGAIAVGNESELVLTDSVILDNASGNVGGGIWVEEGSFLRADRIDVRANNASVASGGGIALTGAEAEIENVIVADNRCFTERGCGVYAEEGATGAASNVELVNATFHGNRSNRKVPNNPNGTALALRGSNGLLTRSLVTGHLDGPPIAIYEESSGNIVECPDCDLEIRNTGFRGNRFPDLKPGGNPASWVIGRLSGEPRYVSADPATSSRSWDLRLRSGSDFAAVGDGTPFEIGAFGSLPGGIPEGPFDAPEAARGTDTDLDGLEDGWEWHVGTNPWVDDAADDPDGDSSTNVAEQGADTDPFVADTDGDGVDDGTEAGQGTDPLDPRTHRPTADAGLDGVGWVGEEASASAAGSFDPNGDPLTFQWTLLSVPGISVATLTTDTGPTAAFTPDEPGSYELGVEVTDGLATHTDRVVVRAYEGVLVPDDAATLQAALAAVAPSDAIGLRPGTYEAGISLDGVALTVVGLGTADQVVLQGDAQGPVVSVANAPVELANLTLTGGHGTPYGGGLAVDTDDAENTVSLYGVRIVDNTAVLDGAGAWLRNAPGTIADSLFARNVAGRRGGALWIRGAGEDDHMTIERITMLENRARQGGGIHFETDTVTTADANVMLDGFVCHDNHAAVGACVSHQGAEATGVFAANGTIAGASTNDVSLVNTVRGRTVFRSTVYADNPGSPGASWLFDGDTDAEQAHFAGLDDANPDRARFSDALGAIVDLPGMTSGSPDFALYTRGGDASTDVLVPMGAVAIDRGFLDDLDTDGSRADLGPCGGPAAAASCAPYALDIDGDGLNDGWESLLGPIDTVDPTGDPDSDGLDNATEHAAGTDPRTDDTDLDGIPDDAERGVSDPNDASDNRPVAVVRATVDATTGFVQLDGTASTDPNGDPLTYVWTVLHVPDGSLVTDGSLLDVDTATPSFFADVRGYYRVQLVVSDGVAESRPDRPAIARGNVLEVVTAPSGPLQFATVQEAIDASLYGDTISVGPGTFPTQVDIGDRVITIRGQGIGTSTLTGIDIGSIFTVDAGSLTLVDLTLAEADASAGAGVSCTEGDLSLLRVQMRDGQATRGGGISMISCDVTVHDSEFLDNYVGYRSGLATGIGGAIRSTGGSLEVLRSRFDGNEAADNGGAINLAGTKTTIRNSVFTRQVVLDNGAAIHIGSPRDRPDLDVLVDHCTFVGNDSDDGGVIHVTTSVDEAMVTVMNSLLVESSLYGVEVPAALDQLVEHNGYFANAGDTFPASLVIAPGSDNVRLQDPRFVAWDPTLPELDDLRLLPWSPMIDEGNDTDLGGSIGDIGAFGGLDADPDGDVYLRDRDGDGMTDVWENLNGFDPDVADGAGDADNDGLTNAEEHDAETEPRTADTDGDGIDDGVDTAPLEQEGRPTAELEEALITRDLGTTAIIEAEGEDPDGDAITATWTFIAQPGRASLTNADLSYTPTFNPTIVTFTPDTPGTYRLAVTYSDGTLTSEPAFVDFRVRGDVMVPEDYATVAEAIDGVVEGNTVHIAAGTWPLSYDSGEVSVSLIGAGRGVTILDAEGAGPVLRSDSLAADRPAVTLADLSVTGGYSLLGGGLDLRDTTLTLDNVEVTGNDASEGGGIACANCSVTISDSLVTNNVALHHGGGLAVFTDPAQTLVRSVDVSTTLFAGNQALLGLGGGVSVEGELNGSFTNVIFADNLATRGGAVAIEDRSATGGIFTFDHVTATFNEAATQGAFLHLTGQSPDATVTNSIVWEHIGSDAVTEASSPAGYAQSYCLFADNSGNYDLPTLGAPTAGKDGNLIDTASPEFVDVDAGNWATADWSLDVTSDAIDAGTGDNDPDGSAPDMGAFGGPDGDWVP